jgi:hypothetical protein
MIASCWLGRSELACLENGLNAIPPALPERTPLSRLPAVCGVPLVASVYRAQSSKIASGAKGITSVRPPGFRGSGFRIRERLGQRHNCPRPGRE